MASAVDSIFKIYPVSESELSEIDSGLSDAKVAALFALLVYYWRNVQIG